MVVKMMALDEVVRAFGYDHAKTMVLTFARNIRTIPHLQSAHLGRGVFAVLMSHGEGHAFVKRMATLLACVDQGGGARLAAGSAYWPQQGDNATQLISKAETALSVGMERKREWIAYQDDMEPNVLDLEICSIFANDESVDIRPVFQPILDLRTGTVVSAEILARWNHPERGEIPPSVFVTALEKAGLSAKLASKMIDHAVRVGKALSDSGIDCTISVNITAHDLVEWNLIDGIQSSLRKHAGRADLIRLELTETSVANDPVHARTVLEHLQTLGIVVSVDDFGTGYSSLSYLSIFPIRELKIDRSFVTRMLQDPRHRSIVKSTIAMARELGLGVTAEGVEDEATLDRLKADGCTSAQGYWISKPLPEGEFVAYLHERSLSQG
jgi:EAL domain-containing protein (putative c-di-GMP-specific phosphodiesterase class I)